MYFISKLVTLCYCLWLVFSFFNYLLIADKVLNLGIVMDKKLSFKDQVNEVCSKVFERLRSLWPNASLNKCIHPTRSMNIRCQKFPHYCNDWFQNCFFKHAIGPEILMIVSSLIIGDDRYR